MEESVGARRQLGGDLVRYLPSQAIPAVISFVTIPILTRLLDPSAYGDYRLVLATVGAFGAAGSWMASAIYRFYPEMERTGRLDTFRTTVRRLLAATSLLFAVFWLGGLAMLQPWLGPELRYLFLMGAVLMVVSLVWSVANALVRALRLVTWYSVAVSLNKTLTLALGVGLIVWLGMGVDGLLYGSIAGSVVLLPLLHRVTQRRLGRSERGFDGSLAEAMLRYGAPIALMQVASWVLQLSDRYLIAAFRGTGEVGLYTAAYGIAEQSMQVILLMFQLPFAILGSRVWERQGPNEAARFVTSSSRSYLILAIPAWVGISMLARPVMTVMTDTEYRVAAGIMPLVAGALLLSGIQWWYTSGSTFMKRTGQQAISVLVGVVVNVALNLLFVPRYGYRAAAATTAVAYAAAAVTMIWLSRSVFRWDFPLRSTVRAMTASGAMAVVIVALRAATDLSAALQLALAIPAGFAAYTGTMALLGEPEVLRLIRRIRPDHSS